MSYCLTCSKPFGSSVAVGNFWWSQSYCSKKCAEDDAKKIQKEELKKSTSFGSVQIPGSLNANRRKRISCPLAQKLIRP
jgi:hypothetical protein